MPQKGVTKGMTKIARSAEDMNQASVADFAENGADPRARLNNMGKMGPGSWRFQLSRIFELADPRSGRCAQKRPRQEAGAISVISDWLFGYWPKAVGGSALPSLKAQSFIMVMGSIV